MALALQSLSAKLANVCVCLQGQSFLENRLVKDELKRGGKGRSENGGEQTYM